jgi:hypothetical protein
MRSEVVRADPPPIRQTMMGGRKATSEEISECLTFASHHDPMIAAERLLESISSAVGLC